MRTPVYTRRSQLQEGGLFLPLADVKEAVRVYDDSQNTYLTRLTEWAEELVADYLLHPIRPYEFIDFYREWDTCYELSAPSDGSEAVVLTTDTGPVSIRSVLDSSDLTHRVWIDQELVEQYTPAMRVQNPVQITYQNVIFTDARQAIEAAIILLVQERLNQGGDITGQWRTGQLSRAVKFLLAPAISRTPARAYG